MGSSIGWIIFTWQMLHFTWTLEYIQKYIQPECQVKATPKHWFIFDDEIFSLPSLFLIFLFKLMLIFVHLDFRLHFDFWFGYWSLFFLFMFFFFLHKYLWRILASEKYSNIEKVQWTWTQPKKNPSGFLAKLLWLQGIPF